MNARRLQVLARMGAAVAVGAVGLLLVQPLGRPGAEPERRSKAPLPSFPAPSSQLAESRAWRGDRERGERRTSGALAALQFFTRARAYPATSLTGGGYSAAFAAARALPLPPDRSPAFDGSAKAPPGYRNRWRAVGPANVGGRTLALAFTPGNPRTVWAGSASGGLWKSTTGGRGAQAWSYVATGAPTLAVSSIAFAPGDSNTLYIGTGEVYGYQNALGGVAIRETRGSYGIGILKSVDGGHSWSRSLDWARHQERGVQAVKVDPARPARVWAATSEGVYKSLDAGASWNRVLDVVMAMDLEIDPRDGDVVFAACGNFNSPGKGVYRTRDGGASWTLQSQGWPDFGGMIRLAIAPSDPGVIYASVGNGSADDAGSWLLRSGDGGNSWNVQSSVDFATYQGWYSHDVAVDPTDANRVYVCGIDIWRSTTGGTALARISEWRAGFDGQVDPGDPEGQPNYSHADHHALLIRPDDRNVMYIANDGGVFRTLDGGATYEGCNGGYQTCQFYNGFSSANTDSVPALGGLQDNGTVIYEGRPGWRRAVGGDGGWTAVEPGDPKWMYATTQYLALYRSATGGAAFVEHSPPTRGTAAFISPILVSPASARTIFAASDVVFRSNDRAETWSGGDVVNNGQPVICLAASFKHAGVVYAGTVPDAAGRTVFRSGDGGAHWSFAGGGLPNRYAMDLAVDPADDQSVYCVFAGFGTGHVFHTDNGGLSWDNIGGQLPDVPTSAVVVDPRTPPTLYVGNDLGVFATQDGGTTWFDLRDGLPDAVICTDLSIQGLYRKLRVATHGNGVFERSLLSGASSLPSDRIVELAQNRPNPFNPTTRVVFSLQRIARVEVSVYDVRGRRVRRLLESGVLLPGDHELMWDGTDDAGRPVSSGTYVCQVNAEDQRDSISMTLVR